MSGKVPPPDESIDLLAIKLIGGGRALAHAEGSTWMVGMALPGELVRVRPTRRRARIVEAETLQVLDDPHPARFDDPCPHADRCGGCDWPHVEPGAGAALKVQVAAEAAARFPEIEARLREASIVESPPSYRLRSKLHWHPRDRILGFYGRRSRQIGPITQCRIISPTLAAVLPRLEEVLAERCPGPVDLEVIEGGAKAVAALRPARGGPRHVPPRWLPSASDCPEFAGFHRLTRKSILLPGWGQEHVHMDLPIRLEVPVGSFFQGNRHLVPWLFDRIATLVGPGTEPVFDLHGGVGFLAAAAHHAGRRDLTVVEIHPPAAAAAQNNLPDARIVASPAETFLSRHNGLPANAVAITDPPRSGMTPDFKRHLTRWLPERVVMLGCDPATWSRDTAALMDHGYSIAHLELVDLFPFTHHVEVIAVLELE